MLLEQVNNLLDIYDGNLSVMYPLVKDRLTEYDETEIAFAGEFMFFEEKYLTVKRHMIENGLDGSVIDIGCQLGFQSEIFLNNKSYTGIDVYEYNFFNKDLKSISYMVGSFPNELELDLKDSIVLSIMSLGYFNKYIDEDEGKALDLLENKLKECKTLYITTTSELTNRLQKHFTTCVNILPKKVVNKRFDTYFMSK